MKQENLNRVLEIAEEINAMQTDINVLQEMIENNDFFRWDVSSYVKQDEDSKGTVIYLNTIDLQLLIKDWSEGIESLKKELQTM